MRMKRPLLQEVCFECHVVLMQVLKSKAVALACPIISQEVQKAYCNSLGDACQCQGDYDHLQIQGSTASSRPTLTISRAANLHLRTIAAAIQTVSPFFLFKVNRRPFFPCGLFGVETTRPQG